MSPEDEEVLRERFNYEPETGRIWSYKKGRYVGGVDATLGYIFVTFNHAGKRKKIRAHRLAWFLTTGQWPLMLDHKNRDRSDNRWDNLRIATSSQNNSNSVKKRKHDLPRGVYRNGLRYSSEMMVDYKRIYIGTYDTPEEAQAAHIRAYEEHRGSKWLPQ